jgi:hypothetical protein
MIKPIHFRWHTLQAAEKFNKKAKTEIWQVLYNESSNKNCMMFPYSKKQEKLLHVFITFTDITGNNLRFNTNYITQTKVSCSLSCQKKSGNRCCDYTKPRKLVTGCSSWAM